ncbi:ABC transporter permease [Achromobacter sp. K91]|uniref:Transport permease protein n=1 Tax=Achromobacter aegrifaciens TaxID=1287736 RepID=A0ABU2DD61_ACHAE|nr:MULTISPECIES: ABC transporter permease [Achromobacter]MBD9422450.1 ABC transporter permease [Achromobacter sp. ACM04]MDR7946055.1 ABC transporter permease [Achromobacter aegrifaciens]RIJ03360.1 ABC transporter permease [Achromobacter sp. K91]
MRQFPSNPLALVSSGVRNGGLIVASIKREVIGRYKGSVMGLMWSFINPIIMLAIYTFVFSVVFKARWNTGSDSRTEFALVLFLGLIVFNLFAECFNKASGLIVGNPNFVKKVVFPLEILPWITLGAALFHTLISLVVWLLAYMVLFGVPHLTTLYVPVILVPFCLFILGLCWILASLGVYLRDVSQFIGIMTTVVMFMSPIFYPPQQLPEPYRHLLYLNPLTFIVEQMRAVAFFGNPPDPLGLALYAAAAAVFAWLAFAWFQKTRKGFADVL